MKNKAIIKNIKRYNNIKLAKGIILNEVETQRRKGYNGISTENYGNNWYILPKGRAIFKTYDFNSRHFDNIKNMRLANEIICYELAKQIDLPCAKYELASKGLTKGVVSYDVTKETETAINLYEYYELSNVDFLDDSIKKFSRSLDILKNKGYNLNKDEMLKTYFKIAFFDTLTAQSDRHNNNILMLVDKQNKTARVAPIIDNEMAFNIVYLDEMLQKGPTIHPNTFLNKLKEIGCMLMIKQYDYKNDKNCYKSNLVELIKIAKTNDEYLKIFKNMLNNFDMQSAINNTKKQGVQINKSYENYLLFVEKTIKKYIKKRFETTSVKEDNYQFISNDNTPTL